MPIKGSLKHRYYYDRIRINTVISKEDLLDMIDTEELEQYAWRVKICNSYKMTNRIHGYQGRIELFQATDEAVKVLQRYGLERHGVSRLEVARDRMCNNSLVTAKYRQMFQDSHYLKWGKGAFPIGTSRYFGKEMGKQRGMYMLCDLPPRGKLGDTNIVHVEFVLIGNPLCQNSCRLFLKSCV
jgi:hypothetical protein